MCFDYVPSNVTMQTQYSEEELGVRLMERLGTRLVLTNGRKQFLQYAEKNLQSIEEARTLIADIRGSLSGTVTISAIEVLCSYRLSTKELFSARKNPIFMDTSIVYLNE